MDTAVAMPKRTRRNEPPRNLKENIMSKLSTVFAAATLLIAAGAASAQTTREAVIADLVAARNSGELAALQGEKGVEVTTPASAKTAVATAKLPRQAILTIKPTEVQTEQTAALAADHGENAAREMGDFPAPVVRRPTAVAAK
jgi:hypothetical protein